MPGLSIILSNLIFVIFLELIIFFFIFLSFNSDNLYLLSSIVSISFSFCVDSNGTLEHKLYISTFLDSGGKSE